MLLTAAPAAPGRPLSPGRPRGPYKRMIYLYINIFIIYFIAGA